MYNGKLYIRITAANGGYPIENASAEIDGVSAEVKNVKMILKSDRNGVTKTVDVVTPSKEKSTTYGTKKAFCSYFDISVSADGYYRKKIDGVTVFDGVTTELPVNLLPVSRYLQDENIPENYNVIIP